MKIPLLQRIESKMLSIPMQRFYDYVGISRQGYKKALSRLEFNKQQWDKIKDKILEHRNSKDWRAGSRSLFYNLNIKAEFGIGVNNFERLVSDNALSLMPLRLKVTTTKSCAQSWNYPNLLNGKEVNNINQVIVGDLTYIYLHGERFYLFCLTDIYSARIVGHSLSRDMRAKSALIALKKWFNLRGSINLKSCIHHTDGGSQYFSNIYRKMLEDNEIRISRAKTCLENGYAEQRNGLIKNHLLPTIKTRGLGIPHQQVNRIINIYNHDRKQEKLGWLSPVDFEKNLIIGNRNRKLKLHDFEK